MQPILMTKKRQAIHASSFIPFFTGFLPPRFHGIRYMDGGFSDNLPTLDEHTITVSPFCGESDICPRDPSYQLFHVRLRASFHPFSFSPPHDFTHFSFRLPVSLIKNEFL